MRNYIIATSVFICAVCFFLALWALHEIKQELVVLQRVAAQLPPTRRDGTVAFTGNRLEDAFRWAPEKAPITAVTYDSSKYQPISYYATDAGLYVEYLMISGESREYIARIDFIPRRYTHETFIIVPKSKVRGEE